MERLEIDGRAPMISKAAPHGLGRRPSEYIFVESALAALDRQADAETLPEPATVKAGTFATRAFFGPKTMQFLSEVANGGPCSILVNNILALSERIHDGSRRADAVETYGAETHSFDIHRRLDTTRGILGRVKEAKIEPEPKPVGVIGSEQRLQSGVKVYLGLVKSPEDEGSGSSQLGVLVEDQTFVPLVSFTDKRRSDDTQCSFALFEGYNLAIGECIVATRQDENNVVVMDFGAYEKSDDQDGLRLVASQERDRGLVLASDVLQDIFTAMNSASEGQEVDLSHLFTLLDVEGHVARALDLDPEVNYTNESLLRDYVRRITRGGSAQPLSTELASWAENADEGPANAYITTTTLTTTPATLPVVDPKEAGELGSGRQLPVIRPAIYQLVQTSNFFNAKVGQEEATLFCLDLGVRIGAAKLVGILGSDPANSDTLGSVMQYVVDTIVSPGIHKQEEVQSAADSIWDDIETAVGAISSDILTTAINGTHTTFRVKFMVDKIRKIRESASADPAEYLARHGVTTEEIRLVAGIIRQAAKEGMTLGDHEDVLTVVRNQMDGKNPASTKYPLTLAQLDFVCHHYFRLKKGAQKQES